MNIVKCAVCGVAFKPCQKVRVYCSKVCFRESRLEDGREYYRKNKEKINEKSKRWVNKNPEAYLSWSRKYRENNRVLLNKQRSDRMAKDRAIINAARELGLI